MLPLNHSRQAIFLGRDMWITGIDIVNFQKHAKLKTDFSAGVNCIVGETDKGKSCLVRAIKWVFFNEPKGDIVRKFGTTQTKVSIILDDGTIVTRIKSAKDNAYEVHKGGDVVKYDSVGKDIPDAVQSILKALPLVIEKESILLNISGQLEAPFLLQESGGFRMKLFNKLMGSDILDLVSQDLNKDILRIGREERIVAENLVNGRNELTEVDVEKMDKQEVLDKLTIVYGKLQTALENYLKVIELIQKVRVTRQTIEVVTGQIKSVVLPEGIPLLKETAEKFNKVKVIQVGLRKNTDQISQVKLDISKVVYPDALPNLKTLASTYNTVKNLVQLGYNGRTTLKATQDTLKVLGEEINVLRAKYKAMLQQYGKCPVCHTPATQELLDGIDL